MGRTSGACHSFIQCRMSRWSDVSCSSSSNGGGAAIASSSPSRDAFQGRFWKVLLSRPPSLVKKSSSSSMVKMRHLTEVEISCTCEDVIDLRCIRGRYVRSPCSRYMPNVYHVHRKIDTIHDTSTATRYKAGGVRRRSIYSIVLHQFATNHILV